MSKRENVIEINGKRYDAYTGVLLSKTPSQAAAVKSAAPRSLGGISPHNPTAPKPMAVRTQAPRSMDFTRPNPQHLKHHAPNKSATLVRSAVHKPEGSLKKSLHPSSHTHALVVQPQVPVVKKLSHPHIDPMRQKRAVHVPQSEFVRRYADPSSALAPRPLASAAVKPVHASTPAAHAVSTPNPAASSMDVFERALQRANSHTEQAHDGKKGGSKWGKRAFSISAAGLAVLVIAGFVVLQNQANLTVKYASHKAGISASLPSAKPTGFSVGKLSYSPGLVAVDYKNTSSGQTFVLKETSSSWDSAALKDNFVAAADANYHTVQAAGRTVYTYGNGDATWVNGGVWYTVIGNGSLTTNELVDLASSM